MLAACDDGEDGLAPLEDVAGAADSIDINGDVTPIDAALLEIDGDTARHSNVDLQAGDGAFVPVINATGISAPPVTFWLSSGETVIFRADLYSPGTDRFRIGTYTYSPLAPDDPALAGRFFFDKGIAGRDLDGDGEVGDTEEIAVIGGSVTLAGEPPDLALAFDVVLANGVSARGAWRGEFLIID